MLHGASLAVDAYYAATLPRHTDTDSWKVSVIIPVGDDGMAMGGALVAAAMVVMVGLITGAVHKGQKAMRQVAARGMPTKQSMRNINLSLSLKKSVTHTWAWACRHTTRRRPLGQQYGGCGSTWAQDCWR